MGDRHALLTAAATSSPVRFGRASRIETCVGERACGWCRSWGQAGDGGPLRDACPQPLGQASLAHTTHKPDGGDSLFFGFRTPLVHLATRDLGGGRVVATGLCRPKRSDNIVNCVMDCCLEAITGWLPGGAEGA